MFLWWDGASGDSLQAESYLGLILPFFLLLLLIGPKKRAGEGDFLPKYHALKIHNLSKVSFLCPQWYNARSCPLHLHAYGGEQEGNTITANHTSKSNADTYRKLMFA